MAINLLSDELQKKESDMGLSDPQFAFQREMEMRDPLSAQGRMMSEGYQHPIGQLGLDTLIGTLFPAYTPFKKGAQALTLGKSAANLAARTGQNALMSGGLAALSPAGESTAAERGAAGAAIGGGMTIPIEMLARALKSGNPITRLAAAAVAGGGAGYLGSKITGMPKTTEALGAGLGMLLMSRGKTGGELAAKQLLQHINPQEQGEAIARKTAGEELGLHLTPGEATGSPVAQRIEREAGATPASAQQLFEHGKESIGKQKQIINDFMHQVSPADAQTRLIDPLYETSKQETVPMGAFMKMLQDHPTINEAVNQVTRNPYYARELNQVPMNSIAFLDQIKKHLSDISEGTFQRGEKYLSGLQSKDTKTITKLMDTHSPSYKLAREASYWNKVRGEIQDTMNQAEMGGKNFYDAVLKDDTTYNTFYKKLVNREKPNVQTEAQKKFALMRQAFPHLKSNADALMSGTLAGGLPKSTGFMGGIKDMTSNFILGKYNKAVADFITNPKWDKDFQTVAKMKPGQAQGDKLAALLSRISASTTPSAISGAINQGSDMGQNPNKPTNLLAE